MRLVQPGIHICMLILCNASAAEEAVYIKDDCEEVRAIRSSLGGSTLFEVWHGCARAHSPWRQELRGVKHNRATDVLYVPPQRLISGRQIGGFFCPRSQIPNARVNECTEEGWKTVLK